MSCNNVPQVRSFYGLLLLIIHYQIFLYSIFIWPVFWGHQ